MATPQLGDGQDELVINLTLRRADQEGSGEFDDLLSTPNPELGQGLVDLVSVAGFDPDLSYITFESVVDAEPVGSSLLIGDHPLPE